jgi:hypothetical protein
MIFKVATMNVIDRRSMIGTILAAGASLLLWKDAIQRVNKMTQHVSLTEPFATSTVDYALNRRSQRKDGENTKTWLIIENLRFGKWLIALRVSEYHNPPERRPLFNSCVSSTRGNSVRMPRGASRFEKVAERGLDESGLFWLKDHLN